MARPPKLNSLIRKAKNEGWDHHISTKSDEQALLDGCWFHPEIAEHVCDFFETYLVHSKGKWAGQPFILADCQRNDIILPAFGWTRPDGKRRFNTIGIWVAKKNFKSTMGAGFGLYGLVGDSEGGAEVYCIANDRDQAGIVYRTAADMVEFSPQLSKKLKCTRSSKTIAYGTSAWMRALSADASSAEGRNASMIIIDEIHKFDARGRLLYEAMKYGGVAREEPLTIVISTAGDDVTGVGYEVYEHQRAILDGSRIDTTTFCYIAESDPADDPGDPKTWEKANPMLDITISRDELKDSWQEAKDSPRKVSVFRRYRCNQWVGADNPWLDLDKWLKCGGNMAPDELLGRECHGGLDLALKSDLTAMALCFPLDDGFFAFLVHFFLPGDGIAKREAADRCKYREWERDGWLTLTPGNVTDVNRLKDYIGDLGGKYAMKTLGFDPWNALPLAIDLKDDHGIDCVEMRQGVATMSGPYDAFEDLVKDKKLIHFDNAVLTQQAGQAVAKPDRNGNILIVKSLDAGKRWFRIDGLVACGIALGRTMAEFEESPYASHGALTLETL